MPIAGVPSVSVYGFLAYARALICVDYSERPTVSLSSYLLCVGAVNCDDYSGAQP